MKRIISYLLAAVLFFTPCLQADASGMDPGVLADVVESNEEVEAVQSGNEVPDEAEADGTKQENPVISDNVADNEIQKMPIVSDNNAEKMAQTISDSNAQDISKTVSGDAVEANMSQINVSIISALVQAKSVDYTMSITGQEAKVVTMEESATGQEEIAGAQPVQASATFEGLVAQTYKLTVTAPGFATYTQDIPVDGYQAYSVKLLTGPMKGFAENAHPGVILIGDVDGDGTIGDADKKALIEAIDKGTDQGVTDLNGDGRTDLADLEYFTKSYQCQPVESTIECGVPAAAVQVSGNYVVVEGDVQALLSTEGGGVKLTPANGGEITEDNPVEMEFQIDENKSQHMPVDGIVLETPRDNPITRADMVVTYVENGEEHSVQVPVVSEDIHFLLENEQVTVENKNGMITINLGAQVAVKKVSLKIIGVKNTNLAEISRVEFIGDMANRIPEPQMDIPQNVKAEPANKSFTVNWDRCVNITGYEVWIEQQPDGESEPLSEIKQVTGNTLTVSSLNNEKLTNGKTYLVKVQSVNGTWRSGYSDVIEVTPKADKIPDPPDYVSATGKYKAISVSWKDMEDTDFYNVYYRKSGEGEYIKIGNITANSYLISDLEDKTSYQLYVTGENELGESGPSLVSKAETTDPNPANMPRYKLLNVADSGKVSEHIISAVANGSMEDSPLDTTAGTIWGTVDNDPISYYLANTWDIGGFNNLNANGGLTYEFDQEYKIQTFALQELEPQSPAYGYVKARYWDAQGNVTNLTSVSIQRKTDADGRIYYMIRLPEAITAKKIQFGIARSLASGTITVSEVYFYHYDSLEDDIMALYEDDLHTVLRSDVTQATINTLRTRINTVDIASGEYHPDKESLERELQTAEDILNSKPSSSVRVHNTITTKDVGRGFGGLNAWQPLGVTVAAGEEITVYVGNDKKKTGDNTSLQLVATQYHSEATSVSKVIGTLKIGRNDITIPKLWSIDKESGGALYVQYTGEAGSANDNYAVRVSGGAEVPILDLYQVTDEAQKLEITRAYVEKLQKYVSEIEQKHEELHKNSDNSQVSAYDYEAQNCILGAADILLDDMLLSLPAQQILAGSGNGTVTQRAQKIVTSMDAMEQMMNLFYQHKGLNKNAEKAIDQFPSMHQNIRYQRMFAGAFMYASGNHIGIEYGSAAGMVSGVPVQADENGKWQSGQYFGWGIAHEIGHCINQGAYSIAEITNNYFSVLAQAKETNDSVRFQYSEVYKKVTSGTKGRATNVFTQLGLYWQLHLAYDDVYNYKTYTDHNEQLENLFFARVDSYARDVSIAPQPGGVALTLAGDQDQQLMRLACAAAEKDILKFFEQWGMTPDEGTLAYAGQFPKENRAIYYVNDEARVYRLENQSSGSALKEDGTTEAVGDATTAVINKDKANQVDFTLDYKTISEDDLLGYEIVRTMISEGEESEEQVVGFACEYNNYTFSDQITTLNNRVVTYKVRVIDKYLHRSAAKTLEPVKIEHKGNIDKTNWTVSYNNLISSTEKEIVNEAGETLPCAPEEKDPIEAVIDQDTDSTYVGKVGAGAEVILEFNEQQTVTALQYTVKSGTPIKNYSISVRDDIGEWKEVASGAFGQGQTQEVYFTNANQVAGNIGSYSTSAVKLEIKDDVGTEISISELDVLDVTGDNVDFRRDNTAAAAIGKLAADYQYGPEAEDVIPKDSIVFTGSYKGNPAYNVVLLYDQDGNIVGGTKEDGSLNAYQVILAEVPEGGQIQDVSDGTWVYWIEPDDEADLSAIKKVRVELYRVDNAETNEGQRLVSDSLFETMPETLPTITIEKN